MTNGQRWLGHGWKKEKARRVAGLLLCPLEVVLPVHGHGQLGAVTPLLSVQVMRPWIAGLIGVFSVM